MSTYWSLTLRNDSMSTDANMAPSTKNRVLVWGLSNNLGGTEGVISNVVSVCSPEIAFDFLTTEEIPNYQNLIKGDNRVFVLPKITSYSLEYKKALQYHFEKYSSSYSAVWSNQCDARNIEPLKLGYRYQIPRRIMHSHNSDLDAPLFSKMLAYERRRTILPKLTDRWACSNQAGLYMFGKRPFEIIPNAISFSKYHFSEQKKNCVRTELHIPLDAFVIGSIGRLVKTKNHQYILHLLASNTKLREAYFIVVGDGSEKNNLQALAQQLGLINHVRFIEGSKDVARYYSSFDVFALPSLFEGLPLVLLEAQANNLPVVMSTNVSKEGIISNSIKRVPLDHDSDWVSSLFQSNRKNFAFTNKANYFNLEKQRDFFIEHFTSGD